MISVCMATYNGEKYIKEQLSSILNQLSEKDEIIISDDSSTDKTVEIIESFQDKRIKILKNNKFRQPNLNFEKALKYSKGDIIFLSDQDDVWVENKVEIILNQLKKYDLIVSDAFITDEKLNITNESLFSEINSNRGILKNIIKNTYYGCCITFKRKVLKKALPFPKTREIGHDLWLGIIADRYFKVKFLKEKLIYFRRHENNLTTIKKSKRRLIIKLLGRVKILYYFLKK
jgi:glycosyltransferase, family 2